MANQGRINFRVGFNVDKAGLSQLSAEMAKISQAADLNIKTGKSTQEMKNLKADLRELESILQKSYNFKLNSIDLTKLNSNLKESEFNLEKFQQRCTKAGAEGVDAFRNLNHMMLSTQSMARESHKWLDKLSETFANTVRWSIASATLNNITGSIQKAGSFTKQLDTSLNDIMIVTGKSSQEMEEFAVHANKAAKALGANTRAYTEASLIYYQQGLSDTEVAARSDVTVKAANVTGQSAQTVSEQLTAVWNGYKVSATEAEVYIDKLAAVAASTAADLEELSTGMSKVASAANVMGVDIDQLNGMLATIVSVTREAPESIGTALKTVFARMSDIEAGLDTETTLGEYTSQMAEMGIKALDANGHLRDMGDVVEEIGNKWSGMTREQQVSLAQTIAGTRQYSRMMALFDNWEMYQSSKSTSLSSTGTLQEQQDTYMESMEAHLTQLTASAEKFYMALVDNDGIKTLIDGLTGLVNVLGEVTDALGGGLPLLLAFGSAASGLLSNKMGDFVKSSLVNKDRNRSIKATQKDNIAKAESTISGAQASKAEKEGRIGELRSILYDDQGYEKTKSQFTEITDANGQTWKTGTKEFDQILASRKQEFEKLKQEVRALDQEISIAEKDLFLTKNRQFMSEEEEADFRARIDMLNEAYNEENELEAKKNQIFKNHQEAGRELRKIHNAEEKKLNEENAKIKEQALASLQKDQDKEEAALKKKYDKNKQNLKKSKKYSKASKSDQKKMVGDLEEKRLKEETELAERYAKKQKDTKEKLLKDSLKKQGDLERKQRKEDEEFNQQKIADNKKINQEIAANRAAQENIESDFDAEAAKQRYQEAGEAIGKLTSGVLSLTSAVAMLANIPDIWDDEDASTGEKILKTITVAIPAVLMLATGMSNISKSAATLKEVGPGALKAFFGIGIGAKNADGPVKSLGASIWAAISPLLMFLGIAAGVAAAIAAIAVVVKLASDAYNKEYIEAEKAAERLEDLTQAHINAKTAYEDLISAIEDYKGAQEAIDNLTTGTEEWTQAIAEANQQVMSLISTYPELVKYLSNENGRLTISQEGLNLLADEMEAEIGSTYRAQLLGQIDSDSANLDADRETLRRDLSTEGGLSKGIFEEIMEASQKAGNEDMFSSASRLREILKEEGIGSSAINRDAIIDSIMGAQDAVIELQQSMQANAESADLLRKEIARSKLAETATYASLQKQAGILGRQAPKREDYESNLDYIEALTQYQGSLGGISSQMSILENLYSGEAIQEAAIEKAKIELREGKDSVRDLDKNQKEKLVQEYWARQLNIPEEDIEIDNEDGAHYTIKYTTADGSVEKKTGNAYTDLEDQLAKQRFADEGLSETDLKAALNNFNTLDKLQQKAYETFVGDGKGDFSKLTSSEIESIARQWTFTDKNGEQVAKKIEDLTAAERADLEKLANALGVEATQELLDNFAKGVQNYMLEQDEIANIFTSERLFERFKNSLGGEEDWEALTLTQQKTLSEMWETLAVAFGKAGEEFSFDFAESIAGSEDLVANLLSSVNWFDENSVEMYADTLEEIGIETEEFIRKMKIANDAVDFDLKATEEEFTSIKEVLDSVKEYGDTISAEQYKALGDEAQNYFLRMADGTYALTDSAEEFWNVVREGRQAELLSKLGDASGQLSKAQEDSIKTIGKLTDAQKNAVYEANNLAGDATKIPQQQLEIFESMFEAGGEKSKYRENVKAWEGGKDTLGKNISVNGVTGENLIKYITENAQAFKQNEELSRWYQSTDWEDLREDIDDGSVNTGTLINIEHALNMIKDQAVAVQAEQREAALAKYVEELNATGANLSLEQQQDIKDIIDQILAESTSTAGLEAAQESIKRELGGNYSLFADYIDENVAARLQYIDNFFENFEIDIDPFADINRELSKVQQSMSKISAVQSQMVEGSDKWKASVERINGLLEKEQELLENSSELAREENLKKAQDIADLGTGISIFDSQGNFKSQASIKQELENWVQDNQDLDIEVIEKKTKDFMALYQEILTNEDLILSNEVSIIEKQNEIFANNLAVLEARVESLTQPQEIQKALNEFKRELMDENSFKEMSDTYLSDFAQMTTNLAHFEDEIGKVFSSGLSEADAVAKYEELIESWKDEYLAAAETIKAMEEARVGTVEAISEAYVKQVEYLEEINSLLEHQKNVTELLYGEEAYSELNQYFETALDNSIAISQAAQARLASATERYNNIDKLAMSDEEREAIIQEYLEAGAAAADAMYSEMEARREKYINDTEIRLKEFERSIYGDTDIDLLMDQWNWAQDAADDYYDSVQKIYAIEGLKSKFTSALSSTTNERVQARIAALMEEQVGYAESLDKLSEYDIKRAEQKLSILQAEIALEEARENKNQMRLMRGADGSYTYQYVADQEQIAKLQAELNDANSELYDMDLEEYTSSIDRFNDAVTDLISTIRELGEDGFTDEELEFIDRKRKQVEAIAVESSRINSNYLNTMSNAANIFGANLSQLTQGTSVWLTSDINNIINKVATSGIKGSYSDLMQGLQGISSEYIGKQTTTASGLKDILNGTGEDDKGLIGAYEDLAGKQDAVIKKYQEEYKYLNDTLIPELETLESALGKISGWYDTLSTQKGIFDNIGDLGVDLETLYGAIEKIDNFFKAKEEEEDNSGENPVYIPNTSGPSVGQGHGALGIKERRLDPSSSGEPTSTTPSTSSSSSASSLGEFIAESLGAWLTNVLSHWSTKFDTGGYTGSWGDSSGRMAMLHEKEIVLNKDDTVNFLKAIETTRSIADALNSSKFQSMAQMLVHIPQLKTLLEVQGSTGELQQNVHITADFSGVSCKEEIEEAFMDLINLAAQYANQS